jgi:hypothetical protein
MFFEVGSGGSLLLFQLLETLRQEVGEFKASLGNTARTCLKRKKGKGGGREREGERER